MNRKLYRIVPDPELKSVLPCRAPTGAEVARALATIAEVRRALSAPPSNPGTEAESGMTASESPSSPPPSPSKA